MRADCRRDHSRKTTVLMWNRRNAMPSGISARVSRGSRPFLKAMPVPDCAFARVGSHFKILRQLEAVGRAGVLTESAEHAARSVICKVREHLASCRIIAMPSNDDQILRAGQSTQIAGDAKRLAGLRIHIQARRAAIPLRDHGALQRILLRIDVLRILRTEGQDQTLPKISQK